MGGRGGKKKKKKKKRISLSDPGEGFSVLRADGGSNVIRKEGMVSKRVIRKKGSTGIVKKVEADSLEKG